MNTLTLVSKILSRKIQNGRPLYLIRWQNFGPEEDTWEPLQNLKSCMKMIKTFEENNKELIRKSKASSKKPVVKKGKPIIKQNKAPKTKALKSSGKKLHKPHKSSKEKLSTTNTKRKRESLELPDESSSSDDDCIRYSLNEDVGTEPSKSKTNNSLVSKKESRKLKKLKLDIKKASFTNPNGSGCLGNGKGTPKSKIRLIDSMKSKVFQAAHRPVSPVSGFNSVKSLSGTSQVCGGMVQTSPNAGRPASMMDSYFGDIPAASVVPMIPSSPSAISYKTLLDNLPLQLHPKKGPKREKPDSDDDEDDDTVVERRQSVRSSECAFRYKDIVVKKCPGYTQIWLFSNTKQKNALNPQVIQEIVSAMNYAKYDDSRLVMFSGLGSMFCSGVDLHYLLSDDRKVAARKMVDAIRDLTKTFITFPKPVVAVVNGPAIGMGVGLLPLCDVIYASDKASCYLPYGRLGQTPEGGLSFTLPHLIGFPMANELLFAGRKITAIEAYQLGLVSQVFWPTSMMQDVIPRVQNMAMNSAKAQEATKLLIRSHQRTKLELTSETECNLLYDRWTSSECHKCILSYLEDEKNLVL
ncbi:chromodomain Y-like protein 2 isoform X2 [Liolophura sinensis]|uniref:chromodomain Y-like protein 2 isoform X2 n=1 Tax=Liolophura sinensis TaxID=3198878 RepID=UPI003158FC18